MRSRHGCAELCEGGVHDPRREGNLLRLQEIAIGNRGRSSMADRSAAAKKAALTKKLRAAGKKAAKTRKLRAAGKKAATTRKRRAAGRKAAATRKQKKEQRASAPSTPQAEAQATRPQIW